MPNPFPGMNPYLDEYWRDIHTRLMTYMCDAIQEQLPVDLVAQLEETVTIDVEDERGRRHPDVWISEGQPVPRGESSLATLPVAKPVLVLSEEPEVQRHIEIRDPKTGNFLITAIELLSPTNKIGLEDRRQYREKRNAYIAAGANVIEIDLIRDGDYNMGAPLRNIAPSKRTPYGACVKRAAKPLQFEFYRAPLRERLPVIPVPLRETDQDVHLDLQALIDLCYERGRYARIDYRREPEPPLLSDDAAWADSLLREKGLR